MVSIVITAYNSAGGIGEAVESARRQTFGDIEIIVVDDCSADSTQEILASIEEPRMKVLRNSGNMGAGASRRRGIESSEGEYILLLDSDDTIEEGFIEGLYRKAVENDADIVSGGITVVHENGLRETSSYGDCIAEGEEKILRFWGEKIVFMNNKLIRRSLHRKVPYCTRRFIEDTPVIIPMLYYANKVVYTGCCGYHYRMNSKSLTHTASPFKNALFRALCAEDIISFFEKNGKEYLGRLPLAEAYSHCIGAIRDCRPTPEMVGPYKDEWIELTLKMIERIGIGNGKETGA